MTAAVYIANLARQELDLARRERCVEQMQDLAPQDLVAELEWLIGVQRGTVSNAGWDPFMYRFTFMSAMLTHWLVREKTINIFTTSLFITMGIQAVASVDAQTMNERFEELASRIGETVESPAIR